VTRFMRFPWRLTGRNRIVLVGREVA